MGILRFAPDGDLRIKRAAITKLTILLMIRIAGGFGASAAAFRASLTLPSFAEAAARHHLADQNVKTRRRKSASFPGYPALYLPTLAA